jgi:ribose transport system substrate-binding protein
VMQRRSIVLIGILVVTLLVGAACVQPAAPAAQPTAVPQAPAAQPTAVQSAAQPTAASQAAPAAAGKFTKKVPVKIGYSVYDMQQPYWQSYAKGIEDASKKAGYGFALSDQKSSQQTQVSGSMDLINQGISALVVSPVQPPALPAIIDAAHQAKIPVIIGDVGVAGDYDAFVLSDNEGGGKQAAQYMYNALKDKPGTKEVLAIELHPGSAVGQLRAKGFTDEIKPHADFKVVASLNGNDTVQGGYQATQDTLSAHPQLAGIYATNDPEAEGAVQALKAANKNGVKDVFVVGFNGDAPALALIKAGDMAATIRQDPYGQGQKAVEIATALMNNQPFQFSDPATKSAFFAVAVIDAKNVDQFMSK